LGDDVYAGVGGLGGEDGCYEQFEGVGVVEGDFGVWVLFLEEFKDFGGAFFGFREDFGFGLGWFPAGSLMFYGVLGLFRLCRLFWVCAGYVVQLNVIFMNAISLFLNFYEQISTSFIFHNTNV
jgi:hypothetical protein